LRRWQLLARRASPPVEPFRNGVYEVHWPAEPGVRDELDELVAAERDCCGFASWNVARQGDEIVLRVSSSGGRVDEVAALAAIFEQL
jgi:hypothetical protein